MTGKSSSQAVDRVFVVTPPVKNKYAVGDTEVDLEGGLLKIQYKNGSEEIVPMASDMSPAINSSRLGRSTVSLLCRNKRVFYAVTIVPEQQTPVNPELVTNGSRFDEQKGSHTGTVMEESKNQEVKQDRQMVIHDAENGDRAGLATSKIQSAVSVAWAVMPSKVEYQMGEDTFAADGAFIRVTYDDGSSKDIPLEANMIYGFRTDAPGKVSLVAYYEGFALPFAVTVFDAKRVSESRMPVSNASEVSREVADECAESVVEKCVDNMMDQVEAVRREVPNFYPSSFCVRFEEDPIMFS